MSELYTVEEVADKLKVTRKAIYEWIRQGKLKAIDVNVGIVRIEEEEYLRFIGKDNNNHKEA